MSAPPPEAPASRSRAEKSSSSHESIARICSLRAFLSGTSNSGWPLAVATAGAGAAGSRLCTSCTGRRWSRRKSRLISSKFCVHWPLSSAAAGSRRGASTTPSPPSCCCSALAGSRRSMRLSMSAPVKRCPVRGTTGSSGSCGAGDWAHCATGAGHASAAAASGALARGWGVSAAARGGIAMAPSPAPWPSGPAGDAGDRASTVPSAASRAQAPCAGDSTGAASDAELARLPALAPFGVEGVVLARLPARLLVGVEDVPL
mmetsp:Transcript_63520/g.177674  ORF Transcript_63520/g.177674 Transcript_63520/m.177674 type:complete len:260 (-) Transcript_63520:323-1102(-)